MPSFVRGGGAKERGVGFKFDAFIQALAHMGELDRCHHARNSFLISLRFLLKCSCIFTISVGHSKGVDFMTTRHCTPVDPNPDAHFREQVTFHTGASTDLFTGAFSQTISIPLPPARNGFVPSVSLVYYSEAEGGLMGVGWNLPVPYVARDLSFGMPLYQETKASELGPLVYHIGGSSDRLHYVSNPKPDVFLFRPELENGGFIHLLLHWDLATGRCSIQLETVRLLGASPNSRDSEGANIFAWYVETIKVPPQKSDLLYIQETGWCAISTSY